MLIDFLQYGEMGCVQLVWFAQNRACVTHKRAIIARIIYLLEKTIYGLKRLFMAWKDYLWLEKDYLRLWSNFCRIVSLFLITWHTFNQSMNMNIWVTYIKVIISCTVRRSNCLKSIHWTSVYSFLRLEVRLLWIKDTIYWFRVWNPNLG